MKEDVLIAGVCERDIDLLMLEELQSSPAFRSWFLNRVLQMGSQWATYIGSLRSVTQSSGESDLEAAFLGADGKRLRLMIENKVGAGLQPAQASRYRVRGNNYVSSGACNVFSTVIVAPRRYFGATGGAKGFDAKVTYEDLLDWYAAAEDLGDRRHYKVALLRSAIDKGTLGYQPEVDHVTSGFWHGYWRLAKLEAPELEMSEPTNKPSGAGFIWFRPPSLPKGISVCHKVNRGYVDLQFPGMGDRLNELESRCGSLLEQDMKFAKASKSAAIRLTVPVLNSNQMIEGQEEPTAEGLRAAVRLLRWIQLRGRETLSQ